MPARGRENDGDDVGVGDLEGLPGDQLQGLFALGGEQLPGDLHRGLQPALPPLGLLEQPGVLDRDAGGRGERGHQFLVLGAELATFGLGEVEVSEHLVAHAHRHAEEARHRWVVGREADRADVVGHGPQPDRARVVDQRAEQALAGGQRSDPQGGLVIDPDVDELLQPAAGCEHAERAVARLDELAGGRDDVAEHHRQRHVANDHLVRGQQPAQTSLGRDDVLGPTDELLQQLIEFEPRPVLELERARVPRLARARFIR